MAEKVGLISCSGEELQEGTISRLAVRKVIDTLRPGKVVTICLPLFLAGGEGERAFAKMNPTITIDGCNKLCAKIGTEMHSGSVNYYISIPDLLNGRGVTEENFNEIVDLVASEIAVKVDGILGIKEDAEKQEEPSGEVTCSCFSSPKPFALEIEGEKIDFVLLPNIFLKFKEEGKRTADLGEDFLKEIKIYNYIPSGKESIYFEVLKDYYDYFYNHGKMKKD